MREKGQAGWFVKLAGVGIAVVAAVLVAGTWLMGQSAKQATDDAVRSVSMFYLDELAGRREQVVATNLGISIGELQTAIELMTPEDLSDMEHLRAYQARMKALYSLEKFAFVDEDGLIYTSLGTQDDIGDYGFDYLGISGPEISVKNLHGDDKKVIIAVPVDDLPFMGKTLKVCFMEIDMDRMLEGLSLQTDSDDATFCNLYTRDGAALTDMVLGGLASEDNLLDAMANAQFEDGYSLDGMVGDFRAGRSGVASFSYNGIQETLDYVPVEGTDWMLTYLIRESVISDQISDISDGIVSRSVLQTVLTALVLFAVFAAVMAQTRRSARIALESEKAEAEARVKQEEMEQRLALQERLLEQEQRRARQDRMITALASDYRSVYYVDLDADEGICYQADREIAAGMGTGAVAGERFGFREAFGRYAAERVAEEYRQGFLDFIAPESVRAGLAEQPVIAYRYLVERGGGESFEMLRMAGVRHAEDRDDGIVHAVGVGFTDVDRETRDQMAQSRALADALAAAEEASRAKTAFLSNMSHEIRTPMNAIIGLDSIALSEPGIPEKTRGHLEKIGDSAHHLLGLINDILDVSRIEAGRMTVSAESFSLPKLIEQVNAIIGSQCDGKGLDYRCRVDGDVGECYVGDEVKLRQALINVLGNAVKFTPAGGSVDFGVRRTARFEGRSTLRFTVSDTGAGIDAEFLPRLFDTFSQEDPATANAYGSTGLGMAITKSIVEMMNGDIQVESAKGEGTTFTITVTLLDSDEAPDAGAGAAPAGGAAGGAVDLAGRRVLVAEDMDINAEILQEILKARGIESERAENGRVAVEMFSASEPGRYDAILMDVRMPEMDGLAATEAIRALDRADAREVPIIALTANAFDEDVRKSLQAGLNAHLSKPVEPDVLFETLEALIG